MSGDWPRSAASTGSRPQVERYGYLDRTTQGVRLYACRDCGASVWDRTRHDAFHLKPVTIQTKLSGWVRNMAMALHHEVQGHSPAEEPTRSPLPR